MNILVTLNEKYVRPLFVMLDSLYAQEPGPVDLYLFYSDVSEESREQLQRYMAERGGRFLPIFVDGTAFRDAPVFGYFPKEMYYGSCAERCCRRRRSGCCIWIRIF